MASTDAKPVAIKNQALRVTFPIFDADGDLVTGAAGLDSEVSKDAGTFTDCTNEATEIATASGMYYLDLTSTEMNADTVAIIVKTSTSGAKTTPLTIYPIARGLADLAFPTVSGRSIDVATTGEVGLDFNNVLGTLDAAETTGIATSAALATVQADTDDIQARLPAALVGGRIDANVGAMANNVLTVAAAAADFDTEMATSILAAALTELTAIPPAGPTVAQALQLLYQALRNVAADTDTAATITKDDGTVIGTAPLSDASGTFTKGKYV